MGTASSLQTFRIEVVVGAVPLRKKGGFLDVSAALTPVHGRVNGIRTQDDWVLIQPSPADERSKDQELANLGLPLFGDSASWEFHWGRVPQSGDRVLDIYIMKNGTWEAIEDWSEIRHAGRSH